MSAPRLTGRFAIRVVDVDDLLADGWLASRLVASRGVLWRAESLAAMQEASGQPVHLALAFRDGGERDGELCAGLLGETLTAMPGLFHVHHRHSAAEQSFWHDPDCRQVLPLLVRELRRKLRWRMTSLMWRQVLDDDHPLPGRRLLGQETQPLGVVPLVHPGPEEWLQSLSKSRRQDLRRLRRRHAEDPALEVSQGRFAEVVKGEEVAPLLSSNFDRHNPRKHPLMNSPASPAWLDVTADDPNFQAVTYRDDGELVGVGVVAMHGGTARWLSWGAHYLGKADKRGFYYDAVRRIVELSYAGDNQHLVLGKGMGELKASFGAKLYAQSAVVRTPA